jgi:hypothetical protein
MIFTPDELVNVDVEALTLTVSVAGTIALILRCEPARR